MQNAPDNGPGNDRAIEMKLTCTSVLTRWPCHICGGETEKDQVLCEAEIRDDADLPDGTIRACTQCIAAGNIDERLKRTAKMYEDWAVMTRHLIGRLVVPTIEQWRESAEQADREWAEHFEKKQADEDRAETLMREEMLLNRPEGLVEPPLEAWLNAMKSASSDRSDL